MTLTEIQTSQVTSGTERLTIEHIDDLFNPKSLEDFYLERGDSPELIASRLLLSHVVAVTPQNSEERNMITIQYASRFAKLANGLLSCEQFSPNKRTPYQIMSDNVCGEIGIIACQAIQLERRHELVIPTEKTIQSLVWYYLKTGGIESEIKVPHIKEAATKSANALVNLVRMIR